MACLGQRLSIDGVYMCIYSTGNGFRKQCLSLQRNIAAHLAPKLSN
jgi:hypothetical protein